MGDIVTRFEDGDSEVRIYFHERNIHTVAKEVGALIKGKDVEPWDGRRSKTPEKYKYNIWIDDGKSEKLKNKNCDLKKANLKLNEYKEQYGYENVRKEKIETV